MTLHVTAADLVAAGEHNPYLHGLYAPALQELTLTGLEVEGELPA
jgi:carotenoid cleavage dioxygenase-like enzyme